MLGLGGVGLFSAVFGANRDADLARVDVGGVIPVVCVHQDCTKEAQKERHYVRGQRSAVGSAYMLPFFPSIQRERGEIPRTKTE